MTELSKTGMILWWDLTVPNATEIRDFYRSVVGWDFAEVPMGEYADYSAYRREAPEEPVAGVCHARGINANLPGVWIPYVVVEDLPAAVAAALARGGVVRHENMDAGYIILADPAGAIFALYQTPATSESAAIE
ncbi:MAG: VOC family protein [Fimbriimonadaceae bacterium]|nr:VOC family protein [Fimbriimonadaceae bacterium]